jgi:hypothetical protein
MDISLTLRDGEVSGEFALLVPPGTVAGDRDKLVDEHLTDPLFAFARGHCAVLAADPHDYVRPLDGRDDQGRTRFTLRARLEADRLMPVRTTTRRRR